MCVIKNKRKRFPASISNPFKLIKLLKEIVWLKCLYPISHYSSIARPSSGPCQVQGQVPLLQGTEEAAVDHVHAEAREQEAQRVHLRGGRGGGRGVSREAATSH